MDWSASVPRSAGPPLRLARRGRHCLRDLSGFRAPCSRTSPPMPDWCRAPRSAPGSRCAPRRHARRDKRGSWPRPRIRPARRPWARDSLPPCQSRLSIFPAARTCTPENPARFRRAHPGDARGTAAASPANCRRAGCISSCTTQADKNACQSRNCAARDWCNDAPHRAPTLQAAMALICGAGFPGWRRAPLRRAVSATRCAGVPAITRISAWAHPTSQLPTWSCHRRGAPARRTDRHSRGNRH